MPHITDEASLREYLTLGYRLRESTPHWHLHLPSGGLYATVDSALARSVTV